MYPYVHCRIVYNSQAMKATQVPIIRWVDKNVVVHMYNGILAKHKKNDFPSQYQVDNIFLVINTNIHFYLQLLFNCTVIFSCTTHYVTTMSSLKAGIIYVPSFPASVINWNLSSGFSCIVSRWGCVMNSI